MSHPNADNLLMGSGGSTASFKEHGTTYAGAIDSDPEPRQATDFDTQKPATWDDGAPKMTLPVTLQTDRRDNSDDDGLRTVWIDIPSKMQKAVSDAVRKSGAKGLRAGGRLSVTYIGDGEPARRGLNPPKLYEAAYTPPPSAADQALGVPQEAAQQQPVYGVQAGPGGPQIAPQGFTAYTPPAAPQTAPLYQGGQPPQAPPAQQPAHPDPAHLGTAKAMLAIPGITDDLIKSAAPTVTDEHLNAIRAGQL